MKVIGWLLILILSLSSQAWGYSHLFVSPALEANIPKELVMAIAKTESDMNPYCINIEGKDYYPDDYNEAVKIIRLAQKRKQSFDVGLMQINSYWHKKLKIDPVRLLEPEYNIQIGVNILANEIKKYGLTWQAVGKYHSPNLSRGNNYAHKVHKNLQKIMQGEDFEITTQKRRKKTEKRPLLQDIFRPAGIQRFNQQESADKIVNFRIRQTGIIRYTHRESQELKTFARSH